MNEPISEKSIVQVLKQLKVKNPFRAIPEVEMDFQVGGPVYGDEDMFVRFLREELWECADAPEKAVAKLLKDIRDVGFALTEMDEKIHLHPFFCSAQVQVLHTYLGGACDEALLEKTREEALDYINGPASDSLLRLMLAATDERNGFTAREIQAMFEEGCSLTARLEECMTNEGAD